MPFLSYEQVVASNAVKTSADLNIPDNATSATLQADTQAIRYTMDNTTNPTTSSGMLLLTTEPPREFSIEDISRIRFIRDGASNGNLNVHYYAGRDV